MATTPAPTATLGGVAFHAGPDDVSWDYRMKTQVTKTLGGMVVQILGVDLGDMTVSGRFGVNLDAGDTEAWQDQTRWRERIRGWVARAANQRNPTPLRFTYAPRGWDFKVFIKQFSDVTYVIDDPAPQFQFVFAVQQDGTAEVVKGIGDLYLKRLMDGVNWKQTEYNGPMTLDVTGSLGGQTTGEYLASLAQQAFESGLSGGNLGDFSNGNYGGTP